MAKKKSKKSGQQKSKTQASPTFAVALEASGNLVTDESYVSISEKTNHYYSALNDEEKSKADQEFAVSFKELVDTLKKTQSALEAKQRSYEEFKIMLSAKEDEYEEKLDMLLRKEKEVKNKESELAKKGSDIAYKNAELIRKERSYEEKALDAESGFARKNEELLEKAKEKIDSERNKLTTLEDTLAQRNDELDRIEHNLIEEDNNLKRRKNRLEREEKNFIRDKITQENEIRNEIRNEFIAELESAKNSEHHLNQQIEKYSNREKSLLERLGDYERFKGAIHGRDPMELLSTLDSQNEQISQLQFKLDQKPSDDLESAHKSLEQEYEKLSLILKNKEIEINDLQVYRRNHQLSVIEREALEKENQALTTRSHTLKASVDALKDDFDELIDKQQSKTAFPALLDLDNSSDHNKDASLESIPNLKDFVDALQRRIAWDSETEKELYYSTDTIRIFLAGLSMSRLHLLQGISGTGKTSLAKAFSRAVGGGCTSVAVQAGWRDKDDLIGHYNAFEKKFYERPCLQGLYEAQTPFFANRPYVILLDEMNLSHPEQYFAEFLSALEMDQKDQQLELMTTGHPAAPKLFVNNKAIQIPKNVWFIGTANHDETTFEFADKTYDRAHVMRLPRHQNDKFAINKRLMPVSYSYDSIEKAFEQAKKKHEGAVMQCLDELDHSDFIDVLHDNFGVSWGNRFEDQAKDFIPVIMESGGNLGQALDHLLATKILRKGKSTERYDTEVKDIEALDSALNRLAESLNIKGALTTSKQLLMAELKRKGSQ